MSRLIIQTNEDGSQRASSWEGHKVQIKIDVVRILFDIPLVLVRDRHLVFPLFHPRRGVQDLLELVGGGVAGVVGRRGVVDRDAVDALPPSAT